MFFGIYNEKNERDYSDAEILLHVVEQLAVTAEELRKENYQKVIASLPYLFVWLLGFCNRMNICLEEAVWSKYPGICPYCGAEKNCVCISTDTKPKEWIKNPNGVMPKNITEWQVMFFDIYGRINKMIGVEKTFYHFIEELGESSKEFRLKENKKLREELADSFAWFIAVCNNLKIDFEDELLKAYPGVCSHCREEKCRCSKN
ncbi:MAG: hypothetical protein WC520_04180 [Candidatus Paceibacterota bacterium]